VDAVAIDGGVLTVHFHSGNDLLPLERVVARHLPIILGETRTPRQMISAGELDMISE
jgi:hypothetical protein